MPAFHSAGALTRWRSGSHRLSGVVAAEVVVEHEPTEGLPGRTVVKLRILAEEPTGLPGEDVVVRGAPTRVDDVHADLRSLPESLLAFADPHPVHTGLLVIQTGTRGTVLARVGDPRFDLPTTVASFGGRRDEDPQQLAERDRGLVRHPCQLPAADHADHWQPGARIHRSRAY